MTIACTKESGSEFPVGTTTVTCTATDLRQRTDGCSFNVVVLPPPRIQITRFVAFGDSITWGENGIASGAFSVLDDRFRPRFQVPRTYPTVLYQTLALRYTTQSIVVGNSGAPAEHARDSETRARFSSVVRSGSYDAVLLMEGSNDLSDGFARAAIDSLRTMVREAKLRGVRPYLATIPPMDGLSCCPRRGSAAPLVPGFNDQIRSLAASENIPLVDVYAALNVSPREYLSVDGLHPNSEGYAKIAETFFTSLKSTLEITTAPTTTAILPAGSRYSPTRRRR